MRAVDLLVNHHLPDDVRDYGATYDAKGLSALMGVIAAKHPEKYEEVSKALADIGREASWRQGETIHLGDMLPVIDRERVFGEMDSEIDDLRKQKLSKEKFEEGRIKIWARYSDMLEKMTMKESLGKGNNLAYSVVSGARGKAPQLKSMVTTPGLYTDYKDDLIPLFVRNSFGDGLRPAEYLAGAFGARKSVIATKAATARGGDFAKQAVQSATSTVVTSKDCSTKRGITLDMSDPSVKGRVLAFPAGGYPAGTVLDKHAIAELRKKKVEGIVARSAITCEQYPGVCAKCIGAFYNGGRLPKIGDTVGITASQAIGEPITQSALNTKHVAGVASGKREYSGFDVINQIAQSPAIFPDRASVAENDGRVNHVEDAPQGGSYVTVGETKHYVPTGYPVLVKVGDRVEAGDQLSDGIVDPGDIVRLRGLGEGRKFYAERLKKALDDSGMPADPRSTEILSRSAIDHVVIDDPDGLGGYLPDDMVSYNSMSRDWKLPEDAREVKVPDAVGKYLQVPVLHYSIGTKITNRMADHIGKTGLSHVVVNNEAPGFTAEMSRLRTAAHINDDWLASQHTSHLKNQLVDSAIRGDDTDIQQNVHFLPRLAIGKDFAKNIDQTGKF